MRQRWRRKRGWADCCWFGEVYRDKAFSRSGGDAVDDCWGGGSGGCDGATQ